MLDTTPATVSCRTGEGALWGGQNAPAPFVLTCTTIMRSWPAWTCFWQIPYVVALTLASGAGSAS